MSIKRVELAANAEGVSEARSPGANAAFIDRVALAEKPVAAIAEYGSDLPMLSSFLFDTRFVSRSSILV